MKPNPQAEAQLKHPEPRAMEILPLLRFAMAVCVVGTHMWRAAFKDAGLHAVFGFFVISGYLITRITATSYQGRPFSFLLNRFLRIYPQYLTAIALGALVVVWMPALAKQFNSSLQLPMGAFELLKQLSIFGLRSTNVLLSPPSWSLNVEVYFYLLIGLLTHRSEVLTYIALLVSGVMGYLAAVGDTTFGFYGDVLGNAFVFFLGSSAYFMSRRLHPPRWIGWLMLAVYAVLAFESRRYVTDSPGCYVLLALSAFAVAVMLIRPPQIRPKFPGAVNFIGRLAYPLFLVHWACSTPVFAWLGEQPGARLFFGGMAISLAVACLMVLGIDLPIEKLRRKVRAASGHKAVQYESPAGFTLTSAAVTAMHEIR